MRYLFFLVPMLIFPSMVLAVEVSTFTSIPFLTGEKTSAAYVEALFNASIAIAAILAVIRLIWAGVQYMLSEVVTKKENARKDIRGALLGLLIILASVTILQTINPNLLNLDVIGKGAAVNINNGTPNVTDEVQFKRGDTWSAARIAARCGTDRDCINDYVAALTESCGHNGGTMSWKLDPTVGINWWGTVGYSYYSYTCN